MVVENTDDLITNRQINLSAISKSADWNVILLFDMVEHFVIDIFHINPLDPETAEVFVLFPPKPKGLVSL